MPEKVREFYCQLCYYAIIVSLLVTNNYKCNDISITVHFNVTQWFLAIFMEHRLNTAFSVDV